MAQQRTLQYLAVGLLTDAPQPRRAHTRCTTCPRPLSPVDPSMAIGSVRPTERYLSTVFDNFFAIARARRSCVLALHTNSGCVYTSLCRMWTTARVIAGARRRPCA